MTILHIDSSILGTHSVSRQLSAAIVEAQKKLHPHLPVVTRDLAATPFLHLGPQHMAAMQGAAPDDAALQADLAASGAALDELFAADIIVIGAPMYNFNISSQLKAWIDRILVAGKTFRYSAAGVESLLPPGKKVFVASSRGGIYDANSPTAFLDHQERYLEGVLGFLGLKDVTFIRAEGLNMGPDIRESAIAGALSQIAA